MDWYSVEGQITPRGSGPEFYQFADNPVGNLGIGVKNLGLNRSFSQPLGALYGPGQVVSQGAKFPVLNGAPYAGLNRRDLSTISGPVSPVLHDPTVNALQGNGAYLHGVITLQDLANVQKATQGHS